MLDQCPECFDKDRVILERRRDGVFACPHRLDPWHCFVHDVSGSGWDGAREHGQVNPRGPICNFTGPTGAVPTTPTLSDAQMDEIARRVHERMFGDEPSRETATEASGSASDFTDAGFAESLEKARVLASAAASDLYRAALRRIADIPVTQPFSQRFEEARNIAREALGETMPGGEDSLLPPRIGGRWLTRGWVPAPWAILRDIEPKRLYAYLDCNVAAGDALVWTETRHAAYCPSRAANPERHPDMIAGRVRAKLPHEVCGGFAEIGGARGDAIPVVEKTSSVPPHHVKEPV